ncbi:hypothetical protein GH733_013415, partial [Mirounga leonina]
MGLGPDAVKEASFPPKTISWTTQLQGASLIVGPGGKSSGRPEGAWASAVPLRGTISSGRGWSSPPMLPRRYRPTGVREHPAWQRSPRLEWE